MFRLLLRIVIPAIVIAMVSEIARRSPRIGALLLTLPIVSILAFTATWMKDHDLPAVSKLSRETLVLVPLGLPFFLPLAYADRLGIGFWQSMISGLILASITIGFWLVYGPK